LIIGAGRFSGKLKTPKMSPARRMKAIIISSQKFSFRNVTQELKNEFET
jgi:hypothetical protein